jgi:hypothetical protein
VAPEGHCRVRSAHPLIDCGEGFRGLGFGLGGLRFRVCLGFGTSVSICAATFILVPYVLRSRAVGARVGRRRARPTVNELCRPKWHPVR